ncbi:MAG: DUF952 domain-containing protein [Salibacteraceae bacterium]
MLYHICSFAELITARENGLYHPPSLNREGFIHLSTEKQVLATAQKWFAEQDGLWLLQLDGLPIDALIFETPEGYTEAFPHFYAPLSWTLVQHIAPIARNKKGVFEFPTTWLKRDSAI